MPGVADAQVGANGGAAVIPAPEAESWAVSDSLRSTLANWAKRAGWAAPQFLTDADWPVDVPGSIPGPLTDALRTVAQGFGRASSRPRIELMSNRVIVVTEIGAE
jgi:hypothetical protein